MEAAPDCPCTVCQQLGKRGLGCGQVMTCSDLVHNFVGLTAPDFFSGRQCISSICGLNGRRYVVMNQPTPKLETSPLFLTAEHALPSSQSSLSFRLVVVVEHAFCCAQVCFQLVKSSTCLQDKHVEAQAVRAGDKRQQL